MSVTREERQAMCDTFEQVGPDAPTLCGDWSARDLLAHLIVRERRPDASLGIVVPAFAKRTEKVMADVAERPYPDMIATFRDGPPLWAVPWSLPLVGDRANLFEFYVHHEDLRRAGESWEPRAEDVAREDALWGGLKLMGKMLFRKSPVGVVLRTAGRDDVVVKKGPNAVFVVGLPSEITLVGYGRATDRTRVVLQGEPDDVAAFEASPRGV